MHTLFFNKAIPVFVLPLGASILMLAAALRWRNRVLIALPLALLWILSTPVIADTVLLSLERRYTLRPNAAYPEADSVFVLGGGMLGPRDRQSDQVEWGPAADRFERAFTLCTSGRARMLVLSAGELGGEFSEGARLREIAIQRGLPPASIILTGQAPNTAAEAAALSQIAACLKWKRVLVVTSAVHMPRAMRLFRHCPAEIVPVPVNFLTPAPGQPQRSASVDPYLPHAEALFRSERALREYLGILFYSVVDHGVAVPVCETR